MVLAGACLALVLSGCATGPPRSGFLSDYSKFEKIHDDAPVWDLIDPSGVGRSRGTMRLWADLSGEDDLGKYDRFMRDPTVLRLKSDSAGQWVSSEKLHEVMSQMDDAFAEAMSVTYPLTEEPGEGVLRFRTAITDIYPMSVYTSPSRIAALRWANSQPGGATFEWEAVDSLTDRRIMAVIGKTRGNDFDPLVEKDLWKQPAQGAARFGEFIRQRMEEAHEPD